MFHSDCEELETDQGEPLSAQAYRRVKAQLIAWRNVHAPDNDPVFDETLQLFHVSDVAADLAKMRLFLAATSITAVAALTRPSGSQPAAPAPTNH